MRYPILLSLLLLPIFGLLLFYSQKRADLNDLEKRISLLAHQAAQQKKEKEEPHVADPHFLDKYVETLSLLEPEMKRLQALAARHATNESLHQRLKFLKEGQNKILFLEDKRIPQGPLTLVEEKLDHPLEMNEEDLKKLLVLVEGVTIHPYSPKKERPDLSFLEFDLKKKKGFGEEEVYGVDFKLSMVLR